MPHQTKRFSSDRIWPTAPDELLTQVANGMQAIRNAVHGNTLWHFDQQAAAVGPPDQGCAFTADAFCDPWKADLPPPREFWSGQLHASCAAVLRQDRQSAHGTALLFDFTDTARFQHQQADLIVFCTLKRVAHHLIGSEMLPADAIFPWTMLEGEWAAPEFFHPPPRYGIPMPRSDDPYDPDNLRLTTWHISLQIYGCSELLD
jgi:hypothetical protein